MIYGTFYSNDCKCTMVQITKRTAKKLFENGVEIFLQSSNMRFDNMWQKPFNCSQKDLGYNETFETLINSYSYYNCDSERGKYIHFFVRESERK